MLNKSLTSFHCPSVFRIVSRIPLGENPKSIVTELGTNGFWNKNMLHEAYYIDKSKYIVQKIIMGVTNFPIWSLIHLWLVVNCFITSWIKQALSIKYVQLIQ